MFTTLIAEDNILFRQSLIELLRREFPAMVIEEAKDGMDALCKTATVVPNLIFMDVKLPDGSGLKLTKMIREEYPNIPIIILTNYDLPEYREAAHQGGAKHFCSKGSTHGNEILRMVKSIVSNQGPLTRI